jgi:multiple sugar transport system permease protein
MTKLEHSAADSRLAGTKGFFEKHSNGLLLTPYIILFSMFIAIPVVVAVVLSFTDFNAVQLPGYVGLKNYIDLFTHDEPFMRHVVPNTVLFALVTGLGGYFLCFILAWSISQISKGPRMVLAVIIYSPSLTSGAMLAYVWRVFFAGDSGGWFNYVLMQLNLIDEPRVWLQDPTTLMPVMLFVTLWSAMGIGFLAILAGILNSNMELYDAAYIDGVQNRWQEIFYVTIPSIRPQMLFGAVMSIVGMIQAGDIGVLLSGYNPPPGYAGSLILTHIAEIGFFRFEIGYAAAVSVVLLLFVRLTSVAANKLFGSHHDE